MCVDLAVHTQGVSEVQVRMGAGTLNWQSTESEEQVRMGVGTLTWQCTHRSEGSAGAMGQAR